jgi:hypothetical protein
MQSRRVIEESKKVTASEKKLESKALEDRIVNIRLIAEVEKRKKAEEEKKR